MLWKTVFYTVIEEFRRRIKAATAQGQKGSEPLRKVHLITLLLHAGARRLPALYAKLVNFHTLMGKP